MVASSSRIADPTTPRPDPVDSGENPEIAPPVEGLLVLGAPESGCRSVGSWLEASGFHPVNTTEGLLVESRGEDVTEPPALLAESWHGALLAMVGGSWDLPPLTEQLVIQRSDLVSAFQLRLQDAIDCAHGAPVVLSDENLLPILPAVGRAALRRFQGLFILRNPLAIARALSAKHDIAVSEGLFLWEHYAAALFSVAEELPVVVVDSERAGDVDRLSPEAIESLVSPGRVAERVAGYDRPSPHLPLAPDSFGAIESEFVEMATGRQIAMWELLTDVAASEGNLGKFPETFVRPSDAAVEALHDGANHRRGRVSRLEAERALNEERGAFELRLATVEGLVATLRNRESELTAERDQLRESVSDLVHRLRVMGVTQAEGHRKAERLSKELDEMNLRLLEYVHDSEELRRVLNSESWRIGFALTLPIRRLKEMALGTPRGTNG